MVYCDTSAGDLALIEGHRDVRKQTLLHQLLAEFSMGLDEIWYAV